MEKEITQDISKEKEFWNNQTKNKYSHYEKGVYSGFKEKEYIDIINKSLPCKPSHSKILDLGCGTGVSTIVLANMGFSNVTGIDLSEELIKQAVYLSENPFINWISKRKYYPYFYTGDIYNLNYLDESVDICFMFGVLHHFKNYHLVVKEVFRVLKKDGIFIIVEPNLLNLPYIISYILVNWKKGITSNEFPLNPYIVKTFLNKMFRTVSLYSFRETDVPFVRQITWLNRKWFIHFVNILKKIFTLELCRGTFFIVSCRK